MVHENSYRSAPKHCYGPSRPQLEPAATVNSDMSTAKETASGRPLKVPSAQEALDPYVLAGAAEDTRGLPEGRGTGKMPCRVQNCAGFD